MQMDWSYVGAVVISGLTIVFVALILLIAAVWIMGKIFTAFGSSGKKKPDAKNDVQPVKAAPAPQTSAEISDGDEVIAVIAAAVAAMSEECGKPLRIKSIRPVGRKSRANAWAGAAAAETTRAF